jgi:hypothetical protein
VKGIHPADLAYILETLTPDERLLVWEQLGDIQRGEGPGRSFRGRRGAVDLRDRPARASRTSAHSGCRRSRFSRPGAPRPGSIGPKDVTPVDLAITGEDPDDRGCAASREKGVRLGRTDHQPMPMNCASWHANAPATGHQRTCKPRQLAERLSERRATTVPPEEGGFS